MGCRKGLLTGASALLLYACPVFAAESVPPPSTVSVANIATVTLPDGWTRQDTSAGPVLTAPEGDTVMAVQAAPGAADARAAANAMWSSVRPGFDHPVSIERALGSDGGWEEIVALGYDIAPSEKAAAQAIMFRKGKDWVGILVDGSVATLAKRSGQTSVIYESLEPAGYVKESFAGRTPQPLDAGRIAELRRFVADALGPLHLPGAALAVVGGGKVLYEGGIGVRDLASRAPITPDTRFMIASNTKGMVTLLLATLVDEGKLDWDAPVVRYLPQFRLGDAATTKKVLVRHLVCACTGLPRDDLHWILSTPDGTPATATFDLLAKTQPTSGFGEVYQYSNPLASAAGFLAAHILYPDMEPGAAFVRAMQERVFDPIGMSGATFDNAAAMGGNWAKPHGLDFAGRVAPVDQALNNVIGPYRPAGGEWATVHDMALYVLEELGAGTMPDGTRVASARNALVRRDYGVPNGQNVWYGMGLETDASSGATVIQHGGSMLGYKTDWYAVPEADAGVVLLLNSDAVSHSLGEAVKRKFLELLYDGENKAADMVAFRARILAEDIARDGKEMVFPVPAEKARTLVGRYRSDELGPLTLTFEAGTLTMRTLSSWSAMALKPAADGSEGLVPVSPGALSFPFQVVIRDGRRALVVDDGQHEFVFHKN